MPGALRISQSLLSRESCVQGRAFADLSGSMSSELHRAGPSALQRILQGADAQLEAAEARLDDVLDSALDLEMGGMDDFDDSDGAAFKMSRGCRRQ